MRNVHLRSCGCWWRGGRETSPAVQRPTKVAAIACSDQECVHFVPSHYLRAPPIGRPGHPYAIESATIAAGVVSLTGLPNWSPKKGPITDSIPSVIGGGSNDSDIVPTSCPRPTRSLAHHSRDYSCSPFDRPEYSRPGRVVRAESAGWQYLAASTIFWWVR